MMKQHPLYILICLFMINFCLGQSKKDEEKHLTVQQWQEDFRSLYDSLRINHLNLYHFTSKADFDKKYQSIYKQIPALTEDEIILRFKQFVSLVGDGHTMLLEPERYKRYPLNFFVFDKRVVLIRSEDKYKEVLGLPLISINNFPIKQIRDSLNTIVSRGESTSYIIHQQMNRLNIAEYLMAFGFISNSDTAVFEFLKGTKRVKINVSVSPNNETVNWKWAYNKLPLFLSNGQEPKPPIFYHVINRDAFYINFSGYPSWKDFEKITENIYDRLTHQKGINKIIIDMRLNRGGNFDKGLKLMLPMFLNFNALHPSVKYYVVIGRQTFSAGMSNTAHFKDCLNALLVGEPTGAIPNGYQEIKWFKLPNSLLSISCSQLFYTFQKKNSDGIQPNKKIKPSFEDYKLGNDPALNWILKR